MNADAAARLSSGLLAILSVAPPYLWKGASHAPLANRAYWTNQKSISSAHRPCERIEKAGWGVLVTREKKMQFPADRDGRPSPHRGRVVRPNALGGKACWAYASTVPVGRSGIRAAHRGLDAPVRRHPFRRLKSHWSTPKIPGFLIREFPQGDYGSTVHAMHGPRPSSRIRSGAWARTAVSPTIVIWGGRGLR